MIIEKKSIEPFFLENIDKFDYYKNLILKNNEICGLTTIKEEEFNEKHFYDSLTLLPLLEKYKNQNLLIADVGAGAGFPSIPILIVNQELTIDLIESNHLKSEFLQKVINHFNFQNSKVICSNVREIKKKYDIVIFRAFSPLQNFIKVAKPILKEGTIVFALKGRLSEIEKEIFIVKKQNLWKYINALEIHQVIGFQWERNIVELIWGK